MQNSSYPSTSPARVLVVDDEPTARAAVTRALGLMGYRADGVDSGRAALDTLETGAYDLMLLDLRMPGMDGVEVMKRAHKTYPELLVIVLTAHATVDSAVAAVRVGAADYLVKPCSIREIEATIARALVRRQEELRRQELIRVVGDAAALQDAREKGESGERREEVSRFVRCGRVTLDQAKRVVVVAGDEYATGTSAELTANEAALLSYLMARPDTVFSCHQLARRTLGYDVSEAEAEEIVRPHISRLRKKLEPDPEHPRLICTVRGKGYLFAPS